MSSSARHFSPQGHRASPQETGGVRIGILWCAICSFLGLFQASQFRAQVCSLGQVASFFHCSVVYCRSSAVASGRFCTAAWLRSSQSPMEQTSSY